MTATTLPAGTTCGIHGLNTESGRCTECDNSTMTVGTIIKSTWGYDQTNVDFYQVIERKVRKDGSTWVKLQELAAIGTDIEGLFMQYTAVPGSAIARKPFWRKVNAWESGEFISPDSYSSGSVWNGTPVHGTSYA